MVYDSVKLYRIFNVKLCLIYDYFESIWTQFHDKDTLIACFDLMKLLGIYYTIGQNVEQKRKL